MPYSEYNDIVALSRVQAGELPRRPPDGITDPVWEFLEKCWNGNPTKRPSTAQVYDALSRFQPLPESVFGVAEGRIDEIAEVTLLVIPLPNFNQIYILGVRTWKFRAGDEQHRRASDAV